MSETSKHSDQQLYLGALEKKVRERMTLLDKQRFVDRLWNKDPALWKDDAAHQSIIANSLGWLTVAETMLGRVDELTAFVAELVRDGFTHVLVMGMGGSSMAPLIFERCFICCDGLELRVLDSTVVETVQAVERSLPLESTFFIASSKSGTTTEPLAFCDYFYSRVKEVCGDSVGQQFAVITDPRSKLQAQAEQRNYRRVFENFPDIGGRYSALSYFGLVPAALAGIDVTEMLQRAVAFQQRTQAQPIASENPSIVLGCAIGELAKQGRDKLCFVLPAALYPLGMWLEQLIAESSGKEGAGLLPAVVYDAEPLAHDSHNRLYVVIDVEKSGEADGTQALVSRLVEQDQPVIRILMHDMLDIGKEFLRWELATATACSILNINAFDQPNVQEAKDITSRYLSEFQQTGRLTTVQADAEEQGLKIYISGDTGLSALLQTCLGTTNGNERYVSVLAYVDETSEIDSSIKTLLATLGSAGAVTTYSYGPRYLHSTGQYHKGGPNSGVYFVLTSSSGDELAIPGQGIDFRALALAQACGDFEALQAHQRDVVRIDLGDDVLHGLAVLNRMAKGIAIPDACD